MAIRELFRNNNDDINLSFDAGPSKRPKVALAATNESMNAETSINTIAIDGYRQGVELTLQKHYDAGIVKIWSGEPGHMLRQTWFGEDKNYNIHEGSAYSDIDYFNPVTYMRLQDTVTSYDDMGITFPIIVADNNENDNNDMNGVIEPLVIRTKASFSSIDVPFESHDVRGAIGAGNIDQSLASDVIVTVDYFDPQSEFVGYLDAFEMITNRSSRPIGIFFNDKISIKPFDDIHYLRNAQSSSYSADMNAALFNMTGSTDNYISYKQRSSTCGWDYDANITIGTDSIAFGGMTY